MISTITTTQIAAITDAAMAGYAAGFTVLILVALLIQKELISYTKNERIKRLRRALNIGIWPLLVAFAVLMVVRIIEIIG